MFNKSIKMIEYIKKMEAAADYHRKMERDELLSKQQILADIYFGNQYGTDHSIITTARDLGEFEERDKINERGTKIR